MKGSINNQTCMPVPLQLGHFWTAPGLPPIPSQPSQMTFFWSASLRTVPLYMSSKETESWCTKFFVLRGPRCLPKLDRGKGPLSIIIINYFENTSLPKKKVENVDIVTWKIKAALFREAPKS